MKSERLHKPENKLEKLLLLYYNINEENLEDVFCYENNNDFILEQELGASRLTVDRYIKLLIEFGRVYVKDEDDRGKYLYLKNNIFLSLKDEHRIIVY